MEKFASGILPESFCNRLKWQLGDEYEAYLRSFEEKPLGGLRVNTLKLSAEDYLKLNKLELKPIPWIPNGFYFHDEEQPAKHPYYYAGLYYLQEPSAMTPARLLPIDKGDRVLDLCAAPGGKSTELAAKLRGSGVLVANDISNSRAKALLKNLELFGVRNAIVVSENPAKLAERFEGYFDKILVDAPCSGEGMFRKSHAIIKNWEQYGVDYYNKLQKEILPHAVSMLRDGGLLLYSTCTFSPEEDEGTVKFLLESYPELSVVSPYGDAALPEGMVPGHPEWVDGSDEISKTLRLWPHRIKGEGHFIALLRKGAAEKHVWCKDPDSGIDAGNMYAGKSDATGNMARRGEGRAYDEKYDVLENARQQGEARACAEKSDATGNTARRGTLDSAQKKSSRLAQKAALSRYPRGISDEAAEFLNGLGFDIIPECVEAREDKLYLVPRGLPEMRGLRIMRSGLLLGEMKTKRFEPSQALASALRSEEYGNVCNLAADDGEAVRYLKGETLTGKADVEDGWALVCADGYPLGWAKATGGQLKNRYLPGWRWM